MSPIARLRFRMIHGRRIRSRPIELNTFGSEATLARLSKKRSCFVNKDLV